MEWDNVSTTGISTDSGFFSEVPWWQHVAVLLGMTVGLLIIASLIFNRREYMAIRDE
jgi:F0F1-type ATP synthase assembly protein I